MEKNKRYTLINDDILDKYNILVKNLDDKKGFRKIDFIRIAVKSKKENDYLIKCLKLIEEKY